MSLPSYSGELASKIDSLEHLVRARLEQPDAQRNTMNYGIHLSKNLALHVTSDSSSGDPELADIGFDRDRMQTGVFVSRLGARCIDCCNVAFSCLYQHRPEVGAGGVQTVSAQELAQSLRIDGAESGFTLPAKELRVCLATLAVARYIEELPKDEGRYELDEAAVSHAVFQELVTAATIVSADGSLYQSGYISRETDDREVLLASSRLSGNTGHAEWWQTAEAVLHVSVIEGDFEHIYERCANDGVEIRMYAADPLKRYQGLKSFQAFYNDDGDLESFVFSEREMDKIEEAERKLGMFEPTSNGVDFFMDRVKQLRI